MENFSVDCFRAMNKVICGELHKFYFKQQPKKEKNTHHQFSHQTILRKDGLRKDDVVCLHWLCWSEAFRLFLIWSLRGPFSGHNALWANGNLKCTCTWGFVMLPWLVTAAYNPTLTTSSTGLNNLMWNLQTICISKPVLKITIL